MLLSSEQREYRRLAKKANQRLLRLERYEESGGLYSQALDMARRLQGGAGRRWKESPANMTSAEMAQNTAEISRFLSTQGSTVGELKKVQKVIDEVKRLGLDKISAKKRERLETYQEGAKAHQERLDKSIRGIRENINGVGNIPDNESIIRALGYARRQKLDKVYSYKTLIKEFAKAQRKGAKHSQIIEAISDLARNEKHTRQTMLDRFKKL